MRTAAGTIEFFEDASSFLEVAGVHLSAEPVLNTVVTTTAQRAAAEPAPSGQPFWFTVVRGAVGEIVGVAMRTAPFEPYPLYVLPMPEDAARLLARTLHERGEHPGGANGALPAAQVFAEEYAALSGDPVRVTMHTRLFELDELVMPSLPSGRPRLAVPGDEELALAWFRAFRHAADEQAGRTGPGADSSYLDLDFVRRRIEQGVVWLWEDGGAPVHMTAFNRPSYGVSRVGPVYTPAEHRQRGYASALVAHVSRMLLDRGVRVCLFTDQANPTSNRIYEALGFRPLVDMGDYEIG